MYPGLDALCCGIIYYQRIFTKKDRRQVDWACRHHLLTHCLHRGTILLLRVVQIDLDLILHRRIFERGGRLRGKVVSYDYFGANLVSRYAFVRP